MSETINHSIDVINRCQNIADICSVFKNHIIKFVSCIFEVFTKSFDCFIKCCICFFDLVYKFTSVCCICFFESQDCIFKCFIESQDLVSENLVVAVHSCFEICESLIESCESFFTVTTITNLEDDRCAIAEVVIGFFISNDDRDLVFILESKYEIFAYSNQKFVNVTVNHCAAEHFIIKDRCRKFRGVRGNSKNDLVTGANNGNGRRQAKRKLCFFDGIGLFNCTEVVVDTFNYNGNFACVDKVCGFYTVSIEFNSVIITGCEVQTVNVNVDRGSLFRTVISYVRGNVYIIFGNFFTFDCIGSCNYATVVALTGNRNDNVAGRGKVTHVCAASCVRNSVIYAFNESQFANLNNDFRLLCILIIDYIGRNGYVFVSNLCLFNCENLYNFAGVVTNTGNRNGNIACNNKVFLKVIDFYTVSFEFNSVISVFLKCQAANRNADFGSMGLSVKDDIVGNGYVCGSNFCFFDCVSHHNRVCSEIAVFTFDHYGNFAYHGKVSSLDTISVEFNSVIRAFNESTVAYSNADCRFLTVSVIGYIVGNGYVCVNNFFLVDCKCDFNPTLIVTNTCYAKGNFTDIGKVGCYRTVSEERICVFFIESENLTVYSNNNFGVLAVSVIIDFDIIVGSVKSNVAERNFYIFFFNLCRIDVINQSNLTFIVAHSFDHYVNFAYVGKIGGFFHNTGCINSAEFNSVIRAFNSVNPRAVRQLSGNIILAECSGFLFLTVVNYREPRVLVYIAILIGIDSVTIAIVKSRAIDVYIEIEVIIFNVGLFDFIGFCNCTHVVADTFDHYSDYTCIGKVGGFYTVSVEFNSVISVFNEITANIDPNRGHMIISVKDYVAGNACIRRCDRSSLDLIIILENIFNRIICISDFYTVETCVNRSTVERGSMIVSKRILRIFHCITSIMTNRHIIIFCEVPVVIYIVYVSLKTVINLIIVVGRFLERQCTAVTAVPMTLTISIVCTVCCELIFRMLFSSFINGLVISRDFKYPFMFMVGIFENGTCFSRMIVYYVVLIIELRKFIAGSFGIDNNELIPIQCAFGNRTVQKISYFTGKEVACILSCSFACSTASVEVVAVICSTFVQTNNAADCVNVNSGGITENIAHVVAAFDRTCGCVFTDNTTDIGNGAADRTDVIANLYDACIETGYTADCIFAVNFACVVRFCYYAAIVFTNNTADIVITFNCTVIVTIGYCARIGTNDTAGIFVSTENGSFIVTIHYRSAVGTNHTTDKSVTVEIRIFNAYVFDYVVIFSIACYITEKTDITYVLVVKIQSGNGIVITVKVTLKGFCLGTDGSPYTEIGTISVERTIVCQNAGIYLDIRSQFSVNLGTTAIDCNSKSIKLVYRVNLIKTICICIFQIDGFRIHYNSHVGCSSRSSR